MKLGFAVKVLGEGGLPTHDARRWQSGPHLRWSVEALHGVFDYLERVGIGMYRMTASLASYATHPDLPQFAGQVAECAEELSGLGSRAAALGLRLSTHPGQYIVLNSEDEAIQTSAVRDLELQGELHEAMGLGPEGVVILHVGGGAGGHAAPMERFERGLERLSERARSRLTIENDDRTFGLSHVLELHRRTGLRVVWDILHHHCNDPDGIPDREALRAALKTWPPGVRPKIHYSTPKTAIEERKRKVGRRVERSWVLPQLRAHADLIDPIAFEHFVRETAAGLDFDGSACAPRGDAGRSGCSRQGQRESRCVSEDEAHVDRVRAGARCISRGVAGRDAHWSGRDRRTSTPLRGREPDQGQADGHEGLHLRRTSVALRSGHPYRRFPRKGEVNVGRNPSAALGSTFRRMKSSVTAATGPPPHPVAVAFGERPAQTSGYVRPKA